MEHYTSATRIIAEVQESLFQRLESTRDPNQAQAIEGVIDERVKALEKIVDWLEIAVNKAAPAQRSGLKFKLDQLKYDHKHLLSAFRTIHARRLNREREQREREELLTRRFTTNDAKRGAGDDTQLDLGHQQYYEDEKSKLHGFHRNVDDMLASAGAALGSLREQAGTLRGARARVMEVVNSLGLSNSVMRLIEKRAHMDKFILFGGMLLLTVVMFLVWKYLT